MSKPLGDSTQTRTAPIPRHVVVVPNGNRRGSKLAGISLSQAYRLGADRALEIAECAEKHGVEHLSFFGLSCENMANRPEEEIDALMEGAIYFCDRAMEIGYSLHPFGHIDQFAGVEKYLPLYLRLKRLGEEYRPSEKFTVHVAANYSGRPEHELAPLMEALYTRGFEEVAPRPMDYILSGGVPPVDLFIRTGGECRTSGMLPFQSSYAELRFPKALWGNFTRRSFLRELNWFAEQPRNFGK